MAKKKYFYDKSGKRISEKEHLRRLRISRSLKKKKKEKKNAITKRRNFRTDGVSAKRPPRNFRKNKIPTITTKRKRAKVKSYPQKASKRFYYTEKRYHELDVPLIISSTKDVETAAAIVPTLIDSIWNDYTKKKIKYRIINVGYHIGMTFTNNNGDVETKRFTVEKVSYLRGFIIETKKVLQQRLLELANEIFVRFNEYRMRQNFYELVLFGFDSEISLDNAFST